MTRIVCEECKKAYDYERDDFCPRCGAYNQPRRTSGAAVRVDGVNEDGHTGSFAHREVHAEKAIRRAVGLDSPKAAKKPAQSPPAARSGKTQEKKSGSSVLAVVVWVIIVIQFLRLFLHF